MTEQVPLTVRRAKSGYREGRRAGKWSAGWEVREQNLGGGKQVGGWVYSLQQKHCNGISNIPQ